MKPHNTLQEIEEMLLNLIEVEKGKILEDNSKEEARSRGVIDSVKYSLLIAKSNLKEDKKGNVANKDQIVVYLQSKLSRSIYEMFRAEEKYKIKQSKRLENNIAYYESMIDTLQFIRENIN